MFALFHSGAWCPVVVFILLPNLVYLLLCIRFQGNECNFWGTFWFFEAFVRWSFIDKLKIDEVEDIKKM